jgi:DNA-binding response OmpR family regulator
VLDGRRLDLAPQMFALFRMLVERSVQRDPVLKAQEIEAQFQRTPREIVRDLRRALVTCGLTEKEVETLVGTVRSRGYRLGLAPSEVVIED